MGNKIFITFTDTRKFGVLSYKENVVCDISPKLCLLSRNEQVLYDNLSINKQLTRNLW